MNVYSNSNFVKRISIVFLLVIQFCLVTDLAYSQDLFGMLPNTPTSYVTKTKIASNGDVFATVWGGGVYKSTNKDNPWTIVSTGLTNFYLTDIEFINSNEMLVSTMGGGVFKTTSLTNINWKETNSGLKNLNVKCIKTYPNGWILIGTYGGGIFISKDKGANWTEASKGLLYRDVTSIEVADNGWIVVGTYGGGVFQSRDTTKTWSRQNSGLKNLFINDIKKSNKAYLYAATNGRGVYLSPNDGITWSELDTFMTRPLKINPVPLPDLNATCMAFNKNSTPVFGSRYGGIYAEDDEEDMTWIPTRIRGIGVNTMSGNNTKMISAFPNYGPTTSNNIGEEWDSVSGTPFLYFANYPKVFSIKEKEIFLYSGNTIKKSLDEGKTWITLAPTTALINKISMDSAGNFYASTDSGLFISDATISTWNLLRFKDTIVYDCEIAPNGSKFVALRYFYQPPPPATPVDKREVWFTTDGNTWSKANVNLDKMAPIPKIIPVNYNGDIYISGGKYLYYSKSNGNAWLLTNVFSHDIVSIGFLRDNTVIVGTAGDGLYKSISPNEFVKLTQYPAKNIDMITVGRNDNIFASGRNVLIDVSYAVYESTYMSKDSGATFTNINNSFNGDFVTAVSVSKAGDMYMSTGSGVIYRAIDSTNLGIPKLLTLADKAKDVDVNSNFTWSSSKRAELYQLEISYNDDFTYVWELVTTSDTNYINAIELYPNHTYYWRVRSKNHSAVSPWSEVRTFISKLGRPTLKLPLDKAINVSVYADMHWSAVEGATKYKVQISKDATFATLEYEWLSTDTITKSQLLQGKTKYFWRVMALNDISTSNWSVVWSFETVFGPPMLTAPAKDATGVSITPQMIWEKAIEVTEYDIQISEKADFSTLAYEKSSIPTTSQISDALEYDKLYYWRVRSRNGAVTSEWSLVWQFRTGYTPVILVTPLDSAVNVAIKTRFDWEKHTTQNKYDIEVSKTSNFSVNADYKTLDNELSYTSDKLEAYQDYFWRVRATSTENIGIWSKVNKYKTKVAQIGLRFPDNNSVNHPISIGFIWYQTKGAKTYHLQIANDAIFNDLIFSQDTISRTSHTFSQLNPGSVYYWRVRAVSPEGVGDWSEVWKFTTGNNIPVLIAPENGKANVVTPVKFEWAAVGGALKYELNVSENSNFSPVILKKDNITDQLYIANELTFPKTYYWRVRAFTNDGTSSWSQTWSLGTVDPAGVKELIKLNNTAIYPNPASNEIMINLQETVLGNYELKLRDVSGKLIFELSGNTENGQIRIDCSKFSSGVYFININSGDRLYHGDVIISR
jgi:photosystem II stability/assembly factor-like uncharacterized protein